MRQHAKEIIYIQIASFIYSILVLCFLLSVKPFLFNMGLLMLTIRLIGHLYILASFDHIDKSDKTFIVLGHTLKDNKMQKTLLYRLQQVIECYKSNKDSKIICSGGITGNNTVSEAAVMKEYLITSGVKEKDIYCEDKSVSTIDNFVNIARIFPQLKQNSIVIISSCYHLRRSKLIAKLAGFENVKALSSKTSLFDILTQLEVEKFACINTLLKMKKRIK